MKNAELQVSFSKFFHKLNVVMRYFSRCPETKLIHKTLKKEFVKLRALSADVSTCLTSLRIFVSQVPTCNFALLAYISSCFTCLGCYGHGVKVGPGPRDFGTLGPGTRDPEPPLKFESGTRDPLRFKVGTPGPPSKCKNGTPCAFNLVKIFHFVEIQSLFCLYLPNGKKLFNLILQI